MNPEQNYAIFPLQKPKRKSFLIVIRYCLSTFIFLDDGDDGREIYDRDDDSLEFQASGSLAHHK